MATPDDWFDRLLALAQALPETTTDHPWGEVAVKVRGKAFVFAHRGADGASLTVKLTDSRPDANLYPWVQPTGYGLGRHGWVTARPAPEDDPDEELLAAWIHESFRAVAPKAVAAKLG